MTGNHYRKTAPIPLPGTGIAGPDQGGLPRHELRGIPTGEPLAIDDPQRASP